MQLTGSLNMSDQPEIRRLYKLISTISKKIKNTLKPKDVTIGWPVFDEHEFFGVVNALLNMNISQGPNVCEFENACAAYLGTKYAVAVNSGSSANLLALSTLIESGDVSKGSEVIIPAATFATVASPILQLGLIPVYVDVDKYSWNIDPKEIEKAITERTRVLMPVHSLGNPADMLIIMDIAKKYKLIVLEDCCEAHGARIGTKRVGSFGDLATWSFFVAHNITTGEGGMVFTNNHEYYEILTSLREFGRLPTEIMQKQRFIYNDPILGKYDTRYIFSRLGYNVRMTDIAASIGIEQLKKLDQLNHRRLLIVKKYQSCLKRYRQYIQLPEIRKETFHSFYGYQIVIKKDAPFTREMLVNFLESNNIETRPFFAGCLPDQPAFYRKPYIAVGDLIVSRWLRDNAVFIGCHPALSNDQINHVVNVFNDFFLKFVN